MADVITRERVENRHEQADSRGRLELVENRRTWMLLELEDEEGYLGRVAFPMDKKHQSIRCGSVIRCLVLSERKDFSKIGGLSYAWLPGLRMWVGEYPSCCVPPLKSCASSASEAAEGRLLNISQTWFTLLTHQRLPCPKLSLPILSRGATVTMEDGGRLNAFATEPRMEVVEAEQGWGFHDRAEKLNGRMAMLGFIALLATELALGGESFVHGLLGLG